MSADRRPPSGVLPSTNRTAVPVRADRALDVRAPQLALGRWGRAVCVVALVAAGVLVGVAMLRSTGATVVTEVTVQPGDTLWSIAQRVAPDLDPRSESEQIRQLNDLDGDAITPGIVLEVPTHR